MLSKLGTPSGTRPLACAFASSIANFFFSILLSRSDKSTCEHRSTAGENWISWFLTHREGNENPRRPRQCLLFVPSQACSCGFKQGQIFQLLLWAAAFTESSQHKKRTKPFSLCRAARFSSRFLEFLLLLLQTVKTNVGDLEAGSERERETKLRFLLLLKGFKKTMDVWLTSSVLAAR